MDISNHLILEGNVIFSSKTLGDGVCIIPTEGILVAPVDGVIETLFPTNHALAILSDDGVEILMHIGIDTVELKGEFFTAKVEQGQHVKKGDVIMEFDINAITKKGYNMDTPIIVTNPVEFPYLEIIGKGDVARGADLFIAKTHK